MGQEGDHGRHSPTGRMPRSHIIGLPAPPIWASQVNNHRDKSIVEFKLAKNSQLERNLEKQAEIYQKASDAKSAIKVIVYFSAAERAKVDRILKRLKLTGNKDVVLIDARKDNKPPASKA